MSTHHQIDLIEFPAASEESVRATAEFFTAVFGWNFKDWGGTYQDTHDSGVAAGINGGDQKEQTMPLTVIYSENIEATLQAVTAAGGTITHPITAFPGGRRFVFTEPGGNQIGVWSK